MPTWMIRSEGGLLYDLFRDEAVVALGWGFLPSLSKFQSRDAIVAALRVQNPDQSDTSLLVQGAQLWRFLREIKIGDRVTTYSPTRRVYSLGMIESEYEYSPSIGEKFGDSDESYPHIRRVKWDSVEIRRDSLSSTTKNSLGSTLSLFRLPSEAERDLCRRLDSEENSDVKPIARSVNALEPEVDPFSADELALRSRERIKDMVARLDWRQMQELVAGILRAMGYRTRVSADGADRGKDIIASPDGLGFEDPRIVVEVKHRPNETMGGPAIRSFLGGRQIGEKGLYVSTGGFTKDARYEAERANVPLTLITLEELVDLLLENYERLDDLTRSFVPLRRIYWPLRT